MQGQDIVGLLTALAAGALALLPAYQKFREVRRDQDAADLARGVDRSHVRPRVVRDRAAIHATLASWETWAGLLLAILILGGLVDNNLRARQFYQEFTRQRDEWRQVVAPALERQRELRAAVARIEAKLGMTP